MKVEINYPVDETSWKEFFCNSSRNRRRKNYKLDILY